MFDKIVHKYLRVPYTLNVYRKESVRGAKVTLIFLHGIGNSGGVWEEMIDALPEGIANIISVDLLGFGASPRPSWARYDLATQAKAVMRTYRRMFPVSSLRGKVVVIGHSLGSLTAVELAKTYTGDVSELVLVAPPFYRAEEARLLRPQLDNELKRIFRALVKRPEELVKLAPLAVKYGLVSEFFSVTPDNVAMFAATLESSIINQTSFDDALMLSIPTQMFVGGLDPLVLTSNIKYLAKNNQFITYTSVFGVGHEIMGTKKYVTAIDEAINRAVSRTKTQYFDEETTVPREIKK